MRDQTLLHMVPYMAHCFAAIAIMKVAYPAANGGIDLFPLLPGRRSLFCEEDYRYYIETMSEWCNKCGVGIWA
jgi:hypothetical protein